MKIDAASQYPGLVRSRLRVANFGVRYLGKTLSDTDIQERKDQFRPESLIDTWVSAVRDGKILRAEGQLNTCGKGLWLSGHGGEPVICAIAQTLIIEEVILSAFYTRVEDFLRAERPEGDLLHRQRAHESDLLLLASYGSERRNDSGWAENTLNDLLASRFDKGLPTLVTSVQRHPESFCGYLGTEMFWSVAIMGGSKNGKD